MTYHRQWCAHCNDWLDHSTLGHAQLGAEARRVEAEAIVRNLAQQLATVTGGGTDWCRFCMNAYLNAFESNHADACPWVRARRWTEQDTK